jgi:hypothetical protein
MTSVGLMAFLAWNLLLTALALVAFRRRGKSSKSAVAPWQ